MAEEFVDPSAVEAGGLDEYNHLLRLDFAVHKLLSPCWQAASSWEGVLNCRYCLGYKPLNFKFNTI